MPEEQSEAAILAKAINIALSAVEISGLGKVVTKINEKDLSNDPRNIVINNVALGTYQLILSEKLKAMYGCKH